MANWGCDGYLEFNRTSSFFHEHRLFQIQNSEVKDTFKVSGISRALDIAPDTIRKLHYAPLAPPNYAEPVFISGNFAQAISLLCRRDQFINSIT